MDVHGPKSGVVNFTAGAVTELAKRGGAGWAQNAQVGGMANKAGHQLIKQAAKVAPGAVAAVAMVTPVAVPVAVVVGVGYVGYRFFKWVTD